MKKILLTLVIIHIISSANAQSFENFSIGITEYIKVDYNGFEVLVSKCDDSTIYKGYSVLLESEHVKQRLDSFNYNTDLKFVCSPLAVDSNLFLIKSTIKKNLPSKYKIAIIWALTDSQNKIIVFSSVFTKRKFNKFLKKANRPLIRKGSGITTYKSDYSRYSKVIVVITTNSGLKKFKL